jgi:Xaa-Pro dipeptidase
MNRKDEINHKIEQIRRLFQEHGGGALWLRHTRNIAWLTGGADASIPVDGDHGMYSIVVTPDRCLIYTDNIEAARMRGEEHFEDLGFEYVEFPWHEPKTPDQLGLLSDDDPGMALALRELREVLLAGEQERYRALGQDAALALEDAVRAVEPGDTEFKIASRLDANCRAAGGLATVNLVGTDERINRYRHPLVTMKPVEKVAMVVVCMRREGLTVAATRFVHFGEIPLQRKEKVRKIAAIDAAVITATQPGRTLGEVFAELVSAYAAQGEAEQWRNHHQGGSIGYNSREKIAVPDDPTLIRVGQAFAWNPSIVGCKSEDTILLNAGGFEIVTTSGDWPMVGVEAAGQTILRPDILVK